ncbi:MAG: hypothetical protein WCH46_08325 [bacterium]
MKNFISVLIVICFLHAHLVAQVSTVSVHKLGKEINSNADDFSPFITNDGLTLFFVTNRGLGKSHLYCSKRKSVDTEWGDADFFQLLSSRMDVVESFKMDGIGRMYFSSTKDSKTGMNLWQAFSDKGNITAKQMPNGINSTFWDSEPTATRNGDVLYFVSGRDRILNGVHLHILQSKLQNDGTWSTPQDLGPKINMGRINNNPFITPDDHYLFFSSVVVAPPSTGRKEITKIYMSEHIGQGVTDWSAPMLLPAEINSESNDIDPMISSDGKTIYFSSDRERSKGYEIYSATLPIDIQMKIKNSFQSK